MGFAPDLSPRKVTKGAPPIKGAKPRDVWGRTLTHRRRRRYGAAMPWLGVRAVAATLVLVPAAGCSLILDFDQALIDAAPPPVDAGPDVAPEPDGGPDPS